MQPGEILSHHEMCLAEGQMLQQGMTFRTAAGRAVLLMSRRDGAPYPDRMDDSRDTLFYVGHDEYGNRDKSKVDQPLRTASGGLTQNGLFFQEASKPPGSLRRQVRVYEKLKPGIWVFNGMFELRSAKIEFDGTRNVCVFELKLMREDDSAASDLAGDQSPGRLIPTEVKLAVWKRDGGRCAKCGVKTNLHFDHILPFSKGGSSTNPENVQLLCQQHNLSKSDKIE